MKETIFDNYRFIEEEQSSRRGCEGRECDD